MVRVHQTKQENRYWSYWNVSIFQMIMFDHEVDGMDANLFWIENEIPGLKSRGLDPKFHLSIDWLNMKEKRRKNKKRKEAILFIFLFFHIHFHCPKGEWDCIGLIFNKSLGTSDIFLSFFSFYWENQVWVFISVKPKMWWGKAWTRFANSKANHSAGIFKDDRGFELHYRMCEEQWKHTRVETHH